MKIIPESTICGGFVADKQVGKDDQQKLNNNLTYTLIVQVNGNFCTKPSTIEIPART